MTSIITAAVSDKMSQNVNGLKGLIQNSIQINKGRIDYSREVGEQADSLTATAVSNINVFSISPENKNAVIKAFLANEPGFSTSTFNPDSYNLSITSSTNSADKIKGLLTISGSAVPEINPSEVTKLISGKSIGKAKTLIRSSYPRVYNFEISTNLTFLQAVNPLPFSQNHITVDIK
jgi:hypothetical protein